MKGKIMKKKAILLAAIILSASLAASLFSACRVDTAGNPDSSDTTASSTESTESEIQTQPPESTVNNSSDRNTESKIAEPKRTITEVPSGELSDSDEFLQGVWLDENGFVAKFGENGRATIFDDFNYTDTLSEPKAVTITAQDADTITITADDTSYTAYHADSAKGMECAEQFVSSAIGEWAVFNYGYEQKFDIKKYNILLPLTSDPTGEKVIVGLDGVRLRMTFYDFTDIYARLSGENLTLYICSDSAVYSEELMKSDSEEYKKLTDAGAVLAGTWLCPDDLNSSLIFSDDGASLKITGEMFGEKSGKTYNTAPKYEDGMINISVDGNALFYAEYYPDDCLEIYTDKYTYDGIELYREDSEVIVKTKEKEKQMQEKAELLKAYPDNDGWLKSRDYGDILALADKAYIDKYADSGYFKAGTPQELASFVYYVNTQPIEQGQVVLELTTDIDLSGYKWSPMGWSGRNDEDHPFAFCVYGNSHTIKNMTIDTQDSDVGFIGWGAVCGVFDLRIENAEVNGGGNVGVITGQAICGRYVNCYASGEVNGYSAGSMLGYEANCDIENCSADVTVNGEKFDFISWNEQQKSEIVIEDPVTITMDEDYTVTRPEVEGYTNLGWMVFEDGKEVLHRNAENELSYQYFGNNPGHRYEIYLTAYVQGQYVPISNTIEYTVE